jgi:hypothetical protein
MYDGLWSDLASLFMALNNEIVILQCHEGDKGKK